MCHIPSSKVRVLLDEELPSLQDVVMVVGGTCIVGAGVTMLAGVESVLEEAACTPVGMEMMFEELAFVAAG